jgi:hypothetical protein
MVIRTPTLRQAEAVLDHLDAMERYRGELDGC